MEAPEIYAEWADCLKQLAARKNDEEVLAAMEQGKLEWQTGVADRFSKRLVHTVNGRLDAALKIFQKRQQQDGAEGNLVQSLLSLRKEIQFLTKVMTLPAIPENVRQQYRQEMQKQADQIQESLEDSAKSDRTGKLLSLLRKTPVNRLPAIKKPEPAAETAPAAQPEPAKEAAAK